MVKRILNICLIIAASVTSLVASCLHHQKQEQPYTMYSESRQYENEVYYNTVESELNDLVAYNSKLHMEDKEMNTNIVSDVVVAGVFVANIDIKKQNTKEIKSYEYEVTKEERKMLQRITEAEATGGDVESKKNIISTILNRVGSSSFPSTIKKVIFQKSQFSPIEDGRFDSVEITEETKQAVEEVLLNGATHECLYFFSMKDVKSTKTKKWINNKLSFEFKDGIGHSYYKEK